MKSYLDILKEGIRIKFVRIKDGKEIVVEYKNNRFYLNSTKGSELGIKEVYFALMLDYYCGGT